MVLRSLLSWMSGAVLVLSLSGCGDSDSPTGPGDSQTGGNIPTAPSGLQKRILSSTQLELSWQDNSSDELGFIIEWKEPNGVFAPVDTVGSNTTSCVITVTPPAGKPAAPGTIIPGLNGEYQVISYNSGGHSAPSEILVLNLDDPWYRILWVSPHLRGIYYGPGTGDEGQEISNDRDYDFTNNSSECHDFLTVEDVVSFAAHLSGGMLYFTLQYDIFQSYTWRLYSAPRVEAWWDEDEYFGEESEHTLPSAAVTVSSQPGDPDVSHSTVPTSVITLSFDENVEYSYKESRVLILSGSSVRFEVQHLNERW